MNVTASTFKGKSAEEWRAEATASRKRSADSWERSDTDGFLSQAASDAMAREYQLNAEIAENGGTYDFPAVFDLNGALVSIKIRDGKFGAYYLNEGPTGNTAPRFINPSYARKAATARKNDEKRGFRMGTVRLTPETGLSAS